MSTSLLYHGFGLVGYTYVRTVYEEGKVIFTVKHKGDKLHCPECGSRDLVLRGCTPRRFRMVPIGSKVTFLDLGIQRVACRRCDTIRQVDLGFADPRFSYTLRLRAVCPGTVQAHDHPRRGEASLCFLGYHQGYPEAIPQEEILPPSVERPPAHGY